MRISRHRMGSRNILNRESNALAVSITGCIEVIEFFLRVQSYFLAIPIDIRHTNVGHWNKENR